jgi:2-oxoisovalerate dehydrogenase E2 component (dihydrolipoyl transacylase)
MKIFKLPDLGEGLVEAEIVEWHVKAGDEVAEDQLLVSVETAKAIVDIPSPQDDRVQQCYGEPGDLVHVGDPLVEFDSSGAADRGTVVGQMEVGQGSIQEDAVAVSTRTGSGIRATPAVRALAHRLKVDLPVVTPSGSNGAITSSDVERVARILAEVGPLEPLRGARRTMAQNMEKAHAEVVAVTVSDDADIDSWSQGGDITVRLIRAIAVACRGEPALNAWYDSHSMGRRLIPRLDLGVAVDSGSGLYVPVLRNAESKNASELRAELNQLKELIDKRSVPLESLRGLTFTLSNFGTFAGRYANPIIMPPSVGILGAGKLRAEVVATDAGPSIHQVLPLSLSFDHRAVTGAEASRFLNLVIGDLQLPE